MKLKYYLKKLRDGYVINQVNHIKLPLFEPSPIVRNRLIFSGRVQKVGFRLETYELILRTHLTVFKGSTLHLRSFKEQATKLVQMSQIKSIIDPQLASHVTREAGKFLSIIDRLEDRLESDKQNKHSKEGLHH